MKYKWLFFDLDNTILDFDKGMVHALNKTIVDYDIPKDENHLAIYSAINKKCWEDFEKKIITQNRLRLLRMERFLRHIKSDVDPLYFSESYHKNLGNVIYYLENAEALIKDWSKDYKMILATNGLKDVQRARLSLSELPQYFEAIVISDEIGVAKPYKGFFDYAFEQIGHPPKEEVLIIGDSLSSDIAGGNRYGIDTCWLDQKGKAVPHHNQPTYVIKKLEELKKILD